VAERRNEFPELALEVAAVTVALADHERIYGNDSANLQLHSCSNMLFWRTGASSFFSMIISPTTHILVVDDDAQIRAVLRNLFEIEGYAVSEAMSGEEMFGMLETEPVNLVTLDLNLAGENGLELAREVRTKRDVPIIMITAKSEHIDRVVGLELGADDYITKPFNLREVLARVRAVLRRYETLNLPQSATKGEHQIFLFPGWKLDVTSRQLTSDAGPNVELTTAEFNLLEVFVTRPARVLSRDVIMTLLKGQEWAPLDRSIDALVGRLRKKIEPDPELPSLIKTVRGVGYVFAADVNCCR
jgi:two-component system, OmpR family, response regulator